MAEELASALKRLTVEQKWKLGAVGHLPLIVGYAVGRTKHALPTAETQMQKQMHALMARRASCGSISSGPRGNWRPPARKSWSSGS